MKKDKLIMAAAVGAGVGLVAVAGYKLLSKDKPANANVVAPFDIDRYMGLWYEIARLPNSVEKNLEELSEEYRKQTDGSIHVVTKAYNFEKREWTEATGKMKFNGPENTGMLKVSYLGPFYLAYNVLDIDADYKYALVSGSGLATLWILSREKTIPDNIKAQFLYTAAKAGFMIEHLEWV